MIRGYDFDTVFLKGINIIKHEIVEDSQGIRLIDIGRDDVFLDYEAHIRHEAKKLNINLDKDYEIKIAKLVVSFMLFLPEPKNLKNLLEYLIVE